MPTFFKNLDDVGTYSINSYLLCFDNELFVKDFTRYGTDDDQMIFGLKLAVVSSFISA